MMKTMTMMVTGMMMVVSMGIGMHRHANELGIEIRNDVYANSINRMYDVEEIYEEEDEIGAFFYCENYELTKDGDNYVASFDVYRDGYKYNEEEKRLYSEYEKIETIYYIYDENGIATGTVWEY